MYANIDFFGKLNAPYYVYAPSYRETSGGVRAMHYLCHALNLIGEEAYVITDTTLPSLRTPSLTAQIRQLHEAARREPIVIYPEIIEDNPLKARNVVRYLLNIPGLLNPKPIKWLTTDLIYTLVPELLLPGMQAPLLETPLVNQFIYNREGADDSKRQGTLVFIHRYLSRGGELQPETANALEISYRVPARSPQELAELYRTAEVLYTYEQSTACYEAILCGCPVVYIPNPVLLPKSPIGYLGREGWAWGTSPEQLAFAKDTVQKAADNYHAIQSNFWKQLHSFVDQTQAHADNANSRIDGTFFFQSPSPLPDAINAYNQGDIEYATQLLSGLLESGSEEPLTYAYLAFICAHQHLIEDADHFIRCAQTLAPERTDLLAALGEVLLKFGDAENARNYLKEAVQCQPDLFAAYPALAEAMRQCGDSESAVQLLSTAVQLPTAAQDAIFASLSELLTIRGDISKLADLCFRRPDDIAARALGICLLVRTDASPDRILTELDRFRKQFLPPLATRISTDKDQQNYPLTVAFLVSDFRREAQHGRLESLLVHLPAERYRTLIINNDPTSENVNETSVQRAFLVSDNWISIHTLDDAAATQALSKYSINVLVDTDGLSIRNRQQLFLSLPAEFKACWSDLPIAQEDIALITGATDLAATEKHPASLPVLPLPGLGHIFPLPELESTSRSEKAEVHFACLTPAVRVGHDSWELFADILTSSPRSSLTVNLGELAEESENFIRRIFNSRSISGDRLIFIQAVSNEDYCHAWNDVDVGLAPTGGNSDIPLATCLWMNRPYIALSSFWPWSSLPASLLQSVGLGDWIATSRESYIEKALGAHRQTLPSSLRNAMRATLPTPRSMAQAFDEALSRALQEMC